MIIKVVYPLNKHELHPEYFEVDEKEFSMGDIVVVENESKHTYGVVLKENMSTKKKCSNKNIKVASQLDRIYFWYDFEQYTLNNKVNLGKVAMEQYRQIGVNGKLTDEQIIDKMTRNLMLIHHPYRFYITNNGAMILNYGQLQLTYNNGTIHYIKNHVKTPYGWKKNWGKHWYFSKILNVEMS